MNIEALFTPLSVGKLVLRNRFVLPAMQRGMAQNAAPSAEMAQAYRRYARGGVGLIIAESSAPDHYSAYWKAQFCRVDHQTADDWRRLADAVKDGGARFFVQLWHPGSIRKIEPGAPGSEHPSLSPSGLVQANRTNGRAMTRAEMADIRDSFVRAALVAKEIGADGVEVHACHGYLLDQFLWAETNIRTDEYGGPDIVMRARFPAEIVKAIAAAVGPDFPISFRFSQWKEVDYGAQICPSPTDLERLIRHLRDAGVHMFHVSTRRFYRPAWPGSERTLSGWTKSFTDAAVIAVGSVGLSTDVCEDLFDNKAPALDMENSIEKIGTGFAQRDFDLIAVGRSHIADPEFVNKIREGRYAQIERFDKETALRRRAHMELVEEHRVVAED